MAVKRKALREKHEMCTFETLLQCLTRSVNSERP